MLVGEPGHEAAVLHIHMHMGHSARQGLPSKTWIVCTCDMCMYTVHVITQYGDGCLGGLITPAHSTVLR